MAEPLGDAAVGCAVVRRVFEWREEDAVDPLFDELAAEGLGFFDAYVGVAPRAGAATPVHSEIMDAGEAGEFAADDFEDFDVAEPGDDEAELLERGTGGWRSGDKGSGTRAALDETLVFQRPQCLGCGGPRHAEAAHQLGFAGQAAAGAVLSGGDLRADFAGDFGVFGDPAGHQACIVQSNELS